jgi:zinc transport system permease protein
MFEILQYDFMVRALEAGLLIGLVSPLIGIFLVLRRYSLIADTLSHVSLAGIAAGLLLHLNPLFTALGASAFSSLAIERLRTSKKVYGETALSIFLSGSLAIAIILIGLSRGFNVDLFSYLFGSIVTVRPSDVYLIFILGIVVSILMIMFYKELVYISFDEDSAKVSGIRVKLFNNIFIIIAATTITISIPVVGILLISALLVIPVITALQLKKGFVKTLMWAEFFSIFSILSGIITSFYLNISSGGTIVLCMLALFFGVMLINKIYSPKSI